MNVNPNLNLQALIAVAVGAIVDVVVALVPSLAQEKQLIISAGVTVITVGFLIYNGLHQKAKAQFAHAAALETAALAKVSTPVPTPPKEI